VPEDDQGSLVADRLPALTRNVKLQRETCACTAHEFAETS
jgi:hypothetical protein